MQVSDCCKATGDDFLEETKRCAECFENCEYIDFPED